MLDRIFSSREYVTLRFAKDEEILVKRDLVEKSRTLEKLLRDSYDNTLTIDKVAHETLDDVFRLLNHEDPIHTDEESMKQLKIALNYLELNDLEKKMQKIQERFFKDTSNAPRSF